ncbi:MAG: ABC transporter permease [Actinomycetota bacterium]|nr:ABC transporter permease [Actinomycetota bacterium]
MASAGGTEGDDLYLTPAFWKRHADSIATEGVTMAVWLEEGGASVDAFAAEAATKVVDESILFVEPGAQDLVGVPALQRAIDVQAAALAAFAALAAVATIVILGQALSRQVVLDAGDRRTLSALGMTRAQLVGTSLVRTGLIGMGAGVLAVAVAVALSPLAPIGLARRAELDPSLEVDVSVLAVGAGLLAASLAAWGLVSAVRATRPSSPLRRSPGATAPPSRLAERLAHGNLPVPVVTGVRMALAPGQGHVSVPVRTAVAGVVVGIAGVTAALVFGASLGRLLGQPELRGWNWDVAVGEYATPDAAEEGRRLLAANPDVSEFSGFGHGPMTVNGVDVELAAVTTDDGLVSSPVVTGRHPTGPGEVAFGLATLEHLGKDLGDTVELTLAGGAPVTARVVGTVIPPAVLAPGMTLGSGGVLTYEGALQVVSEVVGDVPPDRYLVRLRPEADEQTAMARLSADFGDSVLGPTSTSDLENLRRVQGLPVALAALIGVLGLATLAHVLIVGVRRRRRDLAVLKAIGFCRRQVRSVLGWEATSLAGIAVMVGLPIGLLAGTYAWTLVIERIGVSTATAVPLRALVTVLAVVLLANLVAAGPGWAAARTPAAEALRAE